MIFILSIALVLATLAEIVVLSLLYFAPNVVTAYAGCVPFGCGLQ